VLGCLLRRGGDDRHVQMWPITSAMSRVGTPSST
jgi:hypothetical protein